MTAPAVHIVPADEEKQGGAEIILGDLFSWGHRPVMEFRGETTRLTVRGPEGGVAHIIRGNKPSKWWHARAWYRVMRQLWQLP